MKSPCSIELVAQKMGLTPTNKNKNEWRYRNKGSLVLNLGDDTFYDFEAGIGGGVYQFVVHNGYASNDREAAQYLRNQGLTFDDPNAANETNTALRHHIYVNDAVNG